MRDALEQAIDDDPDDRHAYAVYADWLTERGDPRGELIDVQLALEDAPDRPDLLAREAALLEAHGDTWLGPLAPLLRDNAPTYPAEGHGGEVPNYTFSFRRGFLHDLAMERLFVPMARALRDWPDTRRLRHLAIGAIETADHPFEPGDDVPDGPQFVSVYPLLDADLSGLRRFRLGDVPDFDVYLHDPYGPDCHTYCEPLPQLVARMPRVEALELFAKQYDLGALFALPLHHLRSLSIAHFGVSGSIWSGRPDSRPYAWPLDVLASNPALAGLTELRFHPHHQEWHWEHSTEERKASFLPLDQVRHLLVSPHLLALQRLQLRLSDLGDAGVRAIADAGLLSRLLELDLRHGCITDAGAEILARHPDIARLERLDLGGNALSDAGVARIEALGDFATAEAQLSPDEIAEQSYLYRGDTE
ncbi:MAG: TIGR02996 domain-containing protein [Myxococcota bacterium]